MGGNQGSNVSVTGSGDLLVSPTGSFFLAQLGSQSLSITLDTSSAGAKSGSVTIDDLATFTTGGTGFAGSTPTTSSR